MSSGWSAKSGLPGPVRDLLPLNVLLHCRTVVEKQNFVSTGVMTHVEGELFEIELSEFELFDLGEKVKLTVYSPAGIMSFPSTVFAKYEGAIALIQPPDVHKRFLEKREHPRVNISGKARIVHMVDEHGREQPLQEPLEVPLIDISLSGLGFKVPEITVFSRKVKMRAHVDVGIGFSCEFVIVRSERLEDESIFCGARMTVLEPEMVRPLRALILRRQVDRNVQLRKEKAAAKRFNS